jgi:hypothetical protein
MKIIHVCLAHQCYFCERRHVSKWLAQSESTQSMAKKKRTHRTGRPLTDFGIIDIIWRIDVSETVHGRQKLGGYSAQGQC